MADYKQRRVTNDRFGQPQMVVALKTAKVKGGGYSEDLLTCHCEIKGVLYKFTVSNMKSSAASYEKGGRKWLTITKRNKPSGQAASF